MSSTSEFGNVSSKLKPPRLILYGHYPYLLRRYIHFFRRLPEPTDQRPDIAAMYKN
jgi:hypothetical protein